MQQAVTPAEETNKLVGLEALRFLTALAILIFHYRHFAFIIDKPVGLEQERLPLYPLLQLFHDHGAYGVWVFWCISGFIFFWKYRDPIAERTVGGWKFFTLRFSRLYPLHLVTLLSVALLQMLSFDLRGSFFVYQNNDLPHFLTQLFMASEWGITEGLSFDGPIWSVSIEVLVYFLFFLMLRATRLWLMNAVIVVACLMVARLDTNDLVIRFTHCVALFYAGGLAVAARRAADTSRFRTVIETCCWLTTLIVMPLAIHALRDQFHHLGLPLFVVFTPILLFCLSHKINLPHPVQAVIVAAGNMTYSSYLLHFPLQIVIVLCFAVSGRPVPIYSGALFAVYLLTALLLSYFTFRYFEAPAQRFIREAFRRTPRAAFKQASSA